MLARNGSIVAYFDFNDDSKIIVAEEEGGGAKYKISRNEEGVNALSNDVGKTWGEALADGSLNIVNDNIDGPSHGMHGALYIDEVKNANDK